MGTILRNTLIKSKSLRKVKVPSQTIVGYSTKVVPKEEIDDFDKDIKKFEGLGKIQQKIRIKNPQKEPFVKNLFVGVFDTDILTYPEIKQTEEWLQLNEDLKPIQTYMTSEIDVNQKSGKIPKEHLENLARLNAIGLQAPHLLGGREYNDTETLRVHEILAEKSSSIGVITSEYYGINTLIKCANNEQQAKYLQKLVSGNTVSAICLLEENVIDVKQFKTVATLSSDNRTWILNGEKNLVVNGESADIFIVFANTEIITNSGMKEKNYTAFIVDRVSTAGVITKSCNTSGLENTDISTVYFNNVEVPSENILGNGNEGEKVLAKLLYDVRMSTSPICLTLTRNLINKFVDYCKNIGSDKARVYETDAVSNKVAQCVISLYAMESVSYLTSNLIDNYENQDCEIETAITKVFNTESCLKSTSLCLEFLGMPAYMKDNWCNKYYRNALAHTLCNESNDNLKLTIALLGLQYAGIKIKDNVRMLRNPLYFPMEMFKRMWKTRKHASDSPTLNLDLGSYVHPSLVNATRALEYCVLRLQFVTECLLARYGNEIIEKHMELNRLADTIIDIYVATAVIGRASRSYCIGLSNADMELTIANALTFKTQETVRKRMLEVIDGPYMTNDVNYQVIAKKTFENKGYFLEHPLKKNF